MPPGGLLDDAGDLFLARSLDRGRYAGTSRPSQPR